MEMEAKYGDAHQGLISCVVCGLSLIVLYDSPSFSFSSRSPPSFTLSVLDRILILRSIPLRSGFRASTGECSPHHLLSRFLGTDRESTT